LAKRSHYLPNHPAPGLYNLAILPTGGPGSTGPLGDSYGSATVGPSGVVTLVLHLADGLSPALSFSSPLAQDGSFPVFGSLYSGTGILLGWLNFTNHTARVYGTGIDLESTTLFWTKLPGGGLYYPGGFDAASAPMILAGCAYAPSTAWTNRLGWANGLFEFDLPGGGVIITGLSFNHVNNTFMAGFPNYFGLLLDLNAANGQFAGFFAPVQQGPRVRFNGVLLNGLRRGCGFYLAASHQSEPISLGPVAVPQIHPMPGPPPIPGPMPVGGFSLGMPPNSTSLPTMNPVQPTNIIPPMPLAPDRP
jgi:hypothetical protein